MAPDSLRELITGYRVTQLIYVAAELGIADLLKDGPKHYEELARDSGAHALSLFRILRALASVGVFAQVESERFGLNEMAQLLQSDVPNSLRALALISGSQSYAGWGNLLHSVRTGETAFDALYGKSVWEYRAENVRAGQVFDAAMSSAGFFRAEPIVDAYNWAQFGTIIDVGGGKGTVLAAILAKNPELRGVLYDLPGPVQGSHSFLAQAGVLERCETVTGSFLDAVPGGGDAFILSRILHDWHDQQVAQILQNCRNAMQGGQPLLIVERVLEDENGSPEAMIADIQMMVMTGGRERTEAEFRRMLEIARFQLTQVMLRGAPFSLIEAKAI